MLLGRVMDRLLVASDIECALRCQRFPGCESVNVVRSSAASEKKSLCELNQQTTGNFLANLHTDEQSSYYYVVIT